MRPRVPGETPEMDEEDSVQGDLVPDQVDEEAAAVAARAKEIENVGDQAA